MEGSEVINYTSYLIQICNYLKYCVYIGVILVVLNIIKGV